MTNGSNSERELEALIQRVERLNEEKDEIAEDIKQVYAEAKITGFDVRAMRKVVAERKLDTAERKERRAVFDTYAAALNLYPEFE